MDPPNRSIRTEHPAGGSARSLAPDDLRPNDPDGHPGQTRSDPISPIPIGRSIPHEIRSDEIRPSQTRLSPTRSDQIAPDRTRSHQIRPDQTDRIRASPASRTQRLQRPDSHPRDRAARSTDHLTIHDRTAQPPAQPANGPPNYPLIRPSDRPTGQPSTRPSMIGLPNHPSNRPTDHPTIPLSGHQTAQQANRAPDHP